jgi:cob(I)alamin adenosyltransferase
MDHDAEDPFLSRGFVHVYTGEGKGKTTAAFGIALRAAGAGYRVFIGQFMKGARCCEIEAFSRFTDLITLKQYGRASFVSRSPAVEDIRSTMKGFSQAKRLVLSERFKIAILDEINVAIHCRLVPVGALLDLIRIRPKGVELLITGRYAHPKVIQEADLVTEMKELKHYYHRGVPARKGIEK